MGWEMPEQFGPGGQALFDALHSSRDDEVTVALMVECARAKDRLDRLNLLTSGDEDAWCRVLTIEGELVIKLDSAMSEQRQLTTVFRQLLAEVERRQGDRGVDDEDDPLADL